MDTLCLCHTTKPVLSGGDFYNWLNLAWIISSLITLHSAFGKSEWNSSKPACSLLKWVYDQLTGGNRLISFHMLEQDLGCESGLLVLKTTDWWVQSAVILPIRTCFEFLKHWSHYEDRLNASSSTSGISTWTESVLAAHVEHPTSEVYPSFPELFQKEMVYIQLTHQNSDISLLLCVSQAIDCQVTPWAVCGQPGTKGTGNGTFMTSCWLDSKKSTIKTTNRWHLKQIHPCVDFPRTARSSMRPWEHCQELC